MMLLPPAPGMCQECAADHAADEPHGRDSLYYQYRFRSEHGLEYVCLSMIEAEARMAT